MGQERLEMGQQKDVRHPSEQGAGRETAMSQDPLGVTLCLMDVRWSTSQSGPGGPGCAHFTGLNLLPKDTTLGGLSEHLLLTPSWGLVAGGGP